jgi:MFS family permease
MTASTPRSFLGQTVAVLRTVFGARDLRRVELAFAGFNAAEWAIWIALLVYAYERGGTTVAALIAVVLLVPAALFAPLGAVLGDRYRPGRVLCGSYGVQAAGMVVTGAALVLDGPAPLAYATAAFVVTAMTVTRPTMGALTPALARRPEELTAVNAASGWVESVSIFVAPAFAGLVLAVASPGAVFLAMGLAVACGAALVATVPGPAPAGEGEVRDAAHREIERAVGAIRRERSTRVLVAMVAADFVALGALEVLYPPMAIDVLEQDSSWAGYLNAAFGAGAAVAIVVTSGLVGRARLMPSMLMGLALYAGAFLVLAVYQTVALAVVLLMLAGLGRAVLGVGTRTLLQRVSPPDMLARVFGLVEAISMGALALGSLGVAALVALGGVPLALVGIGLVLPLAVLVGGRSLFDVDRRADVPVVQVGLLRSLRLFSPLSTDKLEALARALERADVRAGDVVIREGEEGDRFYLIADGEVAVTAGGGHLRTLRRGDGFGEIALLHAIPRTATCSAVTDTTLYTLGRNDFLAAVTGHPRSARALEQLATSRLTSEAPASNSRDEGPPAGEPATLPNP